MCADVGVRVRGKSGLLLAARPRVELRICIFSQLSRENGEDILSPSLPPSQDGCSPMTFA